MLGRGMTMFNEIKIRHDNYQKHYQSMPYSAAFRMAHKDRGELIKLLDEAKELLEWAVRSEGYSNCAEFLKKLDS
jgi:hypothetical protein